MSWADQASRAVDKLGRVRVSGNFGIFAAMAAHAVGEALREDPVAAKPVYLRLARAFGRTEAEAEADYQKTISETACSTPSKSSTPPGT